MTQTDIKPFTKEDLEKADVQLLRDGRWGNARVSVANINGKRWTIKDFSDRRWLVKNSFAKFVLWRELKAVRKLHGLEGVPTEAFMVTPHMLAIEYSRPRFKPCSEGRGFSDFLGRMRGDYSVDPCPASGSFGYPRDQQLGHAGQRKARVD